MGAAAPTLAAPTVVQLGGHVEKASGGGAMVRAIVKIAKGFHINAHEPDEPFLIPTVLIPPAHFTTTSLLRPIREAERCGAALMYGLDELRALCRGERHAPIMLVLQFLHKQTEQKVVGQRIHSSNA